MRKHSNNKRTFELFEGSEGVAPPSPINSPERPKPLTKRQEQNRAAQRAFRERRAQTLKEMEIRLNILERKFEDFARTTSKINSLESDLVRIQTSLDGLQSAVDSLTVPTWTVPSSEDLKPIYPAANEPIGAILGALRPSSTDPTLSSNS